MFHNVPTFLRPSSEPWIWPHESIFTFFKCLLVEANFPLFPAIFLQHKTNIFPQFSSWTKIFSFPQIDRLSSHTGATSISYWEYWETSVTTNKQLLLQITWQTAHYLKYPYFPTHYGYFPQEISSCIFKDVLVFLDRPTQLADWRRVDLLLGILGTLRFTQQRARFKDWPTRRPERL